MEDQNQSSAIVMAEPSSHPSCFLGVENSQCLVQRIERVRHWIERGRIGKYARMTDREGMNYHLTLRFVQHVGSTIYSTQTSKCLVTVTTRVLEEKEEEVTMR